MSNSKVNPAELLTKNKGKIRLTFIIQGGSFKSFQVIINEHKESFKFDKISSIQVSDFIKESEDENTVKRKNALPSDHIEVVELNQEQSDEYVDKLITHYYSNEYIQSVKVCFLLCFKIKTI